MYRRIVLFLSIVFCLLNRAFGQCNDPFDFTLCVYQLTSAQEAQFSVTDGRISPFWTTWSDSVDLFGPYACYRDSCTLVDSLDARMVLKAAATSHGLYLCAEIIDDSWVADSGADSLHFDAVELYLDAVPANNVYDNCNMSYICYKFWFTDWQYIVPMVTAIPQPRVWVHWYDIDGWTRRTSFFGMDSLYSRFGLKVETVSHGPSRRSQEWYIAWQYYSFGIASGTVLAGKRFALSGGYNDWDYGSARPDLLRFVIKDPWASDAPFVNYWGDLLMPDDMPPVEAYQSVAPRPARTRSTLSATRCAWYDLRGRQLRAAHSGMGLRAVLQRMPTGGTTMVLHMTSK